MPRLILLPHERARQQHVRARFDALAGVLGLRVVDLAEHVGMSRQHTSQLLNGSAYNDVGMRRLEEALEEIAKAGPAGTGQEVAR